MAETILNIYLVIENNRVVGFKAKSYQKQGSDEEMIKFLKEHAREDFLSAEIFGAPQNKRGMFMKYSQFSKLESQGMQYRLFEEIFEHFEVPENPLVCVTPVVDGKVLSKF